ncbi:hypothetical protein VNO78_11350 [Psophocarpus tetragonolobus]|uniref:Uncharacterized protein n=1 Tax=Psophocarpus tetragonolobus TaxID=3891 RepID=A0AAN9XNL1_PSOTE
MSKGCEKIIGTRKLTYAEVTALRRPSMKKVWKVITRSEQKKMDVWRGHITATVGEFLKADERTKIMENIEYVTLLVRIPNYKQMLCEKRKVMINGRIYHIRLIEEIIMRASNGIIVSARLKEQNRSKSIVKLPNTLPCQHKQEAGTTYEMVEVVVEVTKPVQKNTLLLVVNGLKCTQSRTGGSSKSETADSKPNNA